MFKQNNSHFVQLTVLGCKDLIWRKKDLLKGPLILPSYFLFLLWCEVILNVEGFANLLRGLALDHISHGLACQIQQVLNVQVICCLLRTTPKFMWNIWCSNLSILQTTTRNGICEYSPALILPEYILLHSMTFMREDRFVGLCAFILGQLKWTMFLIAEKKQVAASFAHENPTVEAKKTSLGSRHRSQEGRCLLYFKCRVFVCKWSFELVLFLSAIRIPAVEAKKTSTSLTLMAKMSLLHLRLSAY